VVFHVLYAGMRRSTGGKETIVSQIAFSEIVELFINAVAEGLQKQNVNFVEHMNKLSGYGIFNYMLMHNNTH